MRQMLAAIFYLHCNQKVVHRDIKPENFLFLDKTEASPLKIIDFGLAAPCETDTVLKTKAGTPCCVAPQALNGKYCNKCDVWSSGVIMFILLCGYPPFHGESDAEILQRVKGAKLSFTESDWSGVSNEAKDLIRSLLRHDESQRLTAEEALKHPWFSLWDSQKKVELRRELTATILENFRVFRVQSRLKKAAITFVARQLDDDNVARLKEIFLALDSDNNGSLSIEEIKRGLANIKLEKELNIDVDRLLRELDSDGSGNIDYTEFLAAALDRTHYTHEEACWQAFRLFDLDGDGKLTREELLKVLHSGQNKAVAEQEVDMLIKEVDQDGDGQVNFKEFWEMMKSSTNSCDG